MELNDIKPRLVVAVVMEKLDFFSVWMEENRTGERDKQTNKCGFLWLQPVQLIYHHWILS